MRSSIAEIEAVLDMKCPLIVGKTLSGIDRICLEHHLKHTANIYPVGQVRVHSSHALANHFGLGMRFCSCCGAHGQNRSNHLKRPCPGRASESGKEALRLILKGKAPGIYLKSHLIKGGLKPIITLWKPVRTFLNPY